jgi:hypothetical protein
VRQNAVFFFFLERSRMELNRDSLNRGHLSGVLRNLFV